MSEVTNTSLSQQSYNVHAGDSLITQVSKVICILFPRGLMVSGFSDRGDLLMIRYSDYKKGLPPWILDFFEHQFINEQLLNVSHKVAAVFIASDKGLVVPNLLYDQISAEKWMKKINFVEGNEIVSVHNLQEDRANYLFAWPAAMNSLMVRYFPSAKVLPLATYQFYKPYKTENALNCCVSNDQVFATLYVNRQLYWHQVFNYQTAEDIAYHIKLLCNQHKIDSDTLAIQVTATNKTPVDVINELAQFFPNLKDGAGSVNSGDKNFTSTIYLLQQLYACAL